MGTKIVGNRRGGSPGGHRMVVGGIRGAVVQSGAVASAMPKVPELSNHPETGACYFVVLPISEVTSEHQEGYRMNERPWLKFIDSRSFQHVFQRYRDRRCVFVCWLMFEAPWLPRDRRASVLSLYAEAVDDDMTKMLPQHCTWLTTFVRHAKEFDGVLGHTPWMAQKMSALTGLRSEVMPAGYEPRVLGQPNWTAPKRWDTAWYGTMVGKRGPLVGRMRAQLGDRFVDITRKWSRGIVSELQFAKTVLYLCHSDVRSYSTWRTWHAMCSSAALVTEPGDYWPLTPEMCIEVPRIDANNVDDVIRQIRELDPAVALATARRAHEGLREFTVANVIDQYLVPKTVGWLR